MPKALPPIPSQDMLQASEHLSIKPLLAKVKESFTNIPEHRAGNVKYTLVDTLMSASAVFGLYGKSYVVCLRTTLYNVGRMYG